MQPHIAQFSAMGSHWTVRVWDALGDAAFREISADAERFCADFEQRYSRFRKNSWLRSIEGVTGIMRAPHDFIDMLKLYQRFFIASRGACTPLLGATLSDLGYDETYSLSQRPVIRRPADFARAVRIIDDENVEIAEPAAFDLGAMGKGYAVDRIAEEFARRGVRRFLVDGSGDIVYRGDGTAIRAGLEHPDDPTKAIGVIEVLDGAFCASASNRRQWGGRHHIVHPATLESPSHIVATWVLAASAAVADCAATTLFVAQPEPLAETFGIEYCIMGADQRIRRSPGFTAEFF